MVMKYAEKQESKERHMLLLEVLKVMENELLKEKCMEEINDVAEALFAVMRPEQSASE